MTIMESPGLNRASSAITAASTRQARRSPASDYMTTLFRDLSTLCSFP